MPYCSISLQGRTDNNDGEIKLEEIVDRSGIKQPTFRLRNRSDNFSVEQLMDSQLRSARTLRSSFG